MYFLITFVFKQNLHPTLYIYMWFVQKKSHAMGNVHLFLLPPTLLDYPP